MDEFDEHKKHSNRAKLKTWEKKGYTKSLKNMVKKRNLKKRSEELFTLNKTFSMMMKKTIVKHEDYKDWLIKVWENVHTHNRQVQAGYDSIMAEAIGNLRTKQSSSLPQHFLPKEWTEVLLKDAKLYNSAMKNMDQQIEDKMVMLHKVQKINQLYIDLHECFFADFIDNLENAKRMCIRFNGLLKNLSDEA